MRDKIFFLSCFGFALGVLARSLLAVNFYFAVFVLVLSLVILLFSHFTKLKWGIVAAFFILAFAAAGVTVWHFTKRFHG